MTLVEVFRCRGCRFQWGPIGTHGFHPGTQTGQLIGVCRACKILTVARVTAGTFDHGCHQCKGALERHDGTCPKCGSAECGFGPHF